MAQVGIISGVLFILVAVYCAVDPLKHSAVSEFPEFEAYKVDLAPWSEIPVQRDTDNLLQKSEIILLNGYGHGPESLAFDPLGRGPYTGVADGRIIFWNGTSWNDFAITSPNRSELCNPKPSTLNNYLKYEHVCGRPLGLRFNKKTGDLYIADAYFGLMKVGPKGGLATLLVTDVEGVPLRFTNDLDIDEEGNVYFTDSSTIYQRRNYIQIIYSGESSGRVLKYNSITMKTTILVQNIQFPNGISLSKDMSFLVFTELTLCRLNRYWLKGDKVGTTEVFAVLPGFPDNVRINDKGEFWVAIHSLRSTYTYTLAHHPWLRKFLLKLPIPPRVHQIFNNGHRYIAMVHKYNSNGKLLLVLEDNQGNVGKAVSEAQEKDGKLWMGSVIMPFIIVYKLE